MPGSSPNACEAALGPKNEVTSLRRAREELCARVLDGRLDPAAFPNAYSTHADRYLARLLQQATEGHTRGYALLAVGGYGRSLLAPGSDLDLVLLHRARRRYKDVAQRLWYAIWDEGIRLDHSVRTRSEALAVARSDLKVILGLIEARTVAGDTALGDRLIADVRSLWRQLAPGVLPKLAASQQRRHEDAGELAFLLEPDLKRSAGGLRDLAVLRALAAALPPLEGHDPTPLEDAERAVLAARVALQCRTGGSSDRLVLQEQDQVASMLGHLDADALMARLAEAGRTISAACAEEWHRARLLLGEVGPRGEQPVETAIVVREGEVGLAEDADMTDPTLAIRLARVAAERHLPIEKVSLDRLAGVAHRPAEPWNEKLRDAFVALLSTGEALVPAIEAIDRRRLFELYLPEWRAVRNKPQRNAYHRYTVDRHLLEAVARTAPHLGEVDRPDLLVLAALLHDLGKGFPGDHSSTGRDLAENIGTRIGLAPQDVATLAKVVAYHLVLAEFATRRDLDDPSTARVVARLVEDRRTLALLAALTEADSRATGSLAWGPWKAELVRSLVGRVGDVLDGRPLPAPSAPSIPSQLEEVLAEGRLGLVALGRTLVVVAPDRPGLLAAVTGVLALHGCNVLRATVAGVGEHGAVESFDVTPAFDRHVDWKAVESDIAQALAGEIDLEDRLARQEATYARGRRPAAARDPHVAVHLDERTSELATIIEVRAPDRLGLLHHLTATLAQDGLDVVAALVDTLGHEVVDAFYVRERDGAKLSAGRSEQVRAQLLEVLDRLA
jgi:[protein-PII] uridylyltransferase